MLYIILRDNRFLTINDGSRCLSHIRYISQYSTDILIKSEIKDCQGISVRSPSIMDLTLTKPNSLLPDSLYWLIRWVIAKPENEGDDEFS